MLDIKLIRESPDAVKRSLENRNADGEAFALLGKILAMDREWRNIKKEEDGLRAERNKLSFIINDRKKAGQKADAEVKRAGEIAARIKQISVETAALEGPDEGRDAHAAEHP